MEVLSDLVLLLQGLNKLDAELPEQYQEHLNAESLTEGKVKEFLTIYNKLHNCPQTMKAIHQYWLEFSDLPFNIHWLAQYTHLLPNNTMMIIVVSSCGDTVIEPHSYPVQAMPGLLCPMIWQARASSSSWTSAKPQPRCSQRRISSSPSSALW
jgi:hypothetical protein